MFLSRISLTNVGRNLRLIQKIQPPNESWLNVKATEMEMLRQFPDIKNQFLHNIKITSSPGSISLKAESLYSTKVQHGLWCETVVLTCLEISVKWAESVLLCASHRRFKFPVAISRSTQLMQCGFCKLYRKFQAQLRSKCKLSHTHTHTHTQTHTHVPLHAQIHTNADSNLAKATTFRGKSNSRFYNTSRWFSPIAPSILSHSMPDFLYFPTAYNIAIHMNETTNITLSDPCEIFGQNALFLISNAKIVSK